MGCEGVDNDHVVQPFRQHPPQKCLCKLGLEMNGAGCCHVHEDSPHSSTVRMAAEKGSLRTTMMSIHPSLFNRQAKCLFFIIPIGNTRQLQPNVRLKVPVQPCACASTIQLATTPRRRKERNEASSVSYCSTTRQDLETQPFHATYDKGTTPFVVTNNQSSHLAHKGAYGRHEPPDCQQEERRNQNAIQGPTGILFLGVVVA